MDSVSQNIKSLADTENLYKVQLLKYRYTFEKVIAKSIEYDLIVQEGGKLFLTGIGKVLIDQYNNGFENYAISLFLLMESRYELLDI